MESKRDGEKLAELTKVENKNILQPAKKIAKSDDYLMSQQTLQKIASIIDEMPTRYGVVLLKILQEELRKV